MNSSFSHPQLLRNLFRLHVLLSQFDNLLISGIAPRSPGQTGLLDMCWLRWTPFFQCDHGFAWFLLVGYWRRATGFDLWASSGREGVGGLKLNSGEDENGRPH